MAEYEADRDLVKQRVRREQISRQAREAQEAERARAAKYAEEGDPDGEEGGKGDSGWRPMELEGDEDEGDDVEGLGQFNPEGNQDAEQRHDDDDEDEDEDEGRGDFRDPDRNRWGRGNKLGGN